MNVFGHHIPHKTLWVAGGIGAVIAVLLYLRARAAGAADSQAAPAPADQGYGMSIPAPSGQIADQYQQQLNNADLQAATLANTYQANLIDQQKRQFDFQQSQFEALAPAYQAEQQSALAVQTHYNTAASKAAVSCPGSASLRTGPDGQLYCRQKTSGGFLGIPVGDAFRAIQNFVGGVEAAAPSLGYQAAQDAARYYTGKIFPAPTAKPASPRPATVPIAPSVGGHGYGETLI